MAYLIQDGEITDIGGDGDQSPLANGKKHAKKGKPKNFFSADETKFINPSKNLTNYVGNGKKKEKRGIECDPTAPYYLRVALYISGRFFEVFLDRYGPISAYDQLDDYLEAMIDMTQIMFKRPVLNPTVELKVHIVKVWTAETQPAEIELFLGTSTAISETVLSSFCTYAKPDILGYDVAVLLDRRDDGQEVAGIAYLQSACTNLGCAVVAPTYNGFEASFILAHELGHNLAMPHDVDVGCPDNTGIMGIYVGSGSVIQWTSCSRNYLNGYSNYLTGLDANCLCTPFDLDPINTLPGQNYPLEEECIHQLSPCARGNYGGVSVCNLLYCRRNLILTTTLDRFRLDGSYCGSNAVCQSGVCVSVSTATSGSVTSLSPVNGGWTSWNSEIGHECAACAGCVANGVLPLRLDVRTCTNPAPNNNGMDCSGNHLRGVVCGSSCTSSTPILNYVASEVCPAGTASASVYSSGLPCLNRCLNAANTFLGYAISPNGSPCFGSGRCVDGLCFSACASYPNYYVRSLNDCPALPCDTDPCQNEGVCNPIGTTTYTCTCHPGYTGTNCELCSSTNPINCAYTSWSSWSSCGVDCQRTSDRTVNTPGLCGGIKCTEDLTKKEDCSGGQCPLPDLEGIRTCRAVNDPHMRTFDGFNHEFQSDCDHVMVKLCSTVGYPKTVPIYVPIFTVEGRAKDIYAAPSGTLGRDPSNVDRVTLRIGGSSISLFTSPTSSSSTVTGFEIDDIGYSLADLPYTNHTFYTYSMRVFKDSTGYYVIETSFGLTITHRGPYGIYVTLSSILAQMLKRNTCGICGYMNYNSADEFTDDNGVQHSYYSNQGWITADQAFLDQYYLPNVANPTPTGCDKNPLFYQYGSSGRKKRDASDDCAVGYTEVVDHVCALIMNSSSLEHCAADQESYAVCLADACIDAEYACIALQAYALDCNDKGQNGQWRIEAECPPLVCPEHSTYSAVLSDECNPTCANSDPCPGGIPPSGVYDEGCICDSGYVWDDQDQICKQKVQCQPQPQSG